MKKRVYLAGQMGGLTFEEANHWRKHVAYQLDKASDGRIECYSPMRGKMTLFDKQGVMSSGAYDDNPLTTARGIMTRDYTDCAKADLIFANFIGCTQISMGTVMEMGFAYAHRVPVVAVINKNNVHAGHCMMEEAFTFKVKSLLEGVDVAVSFLMP